MPLKWTDFLWFMCYLTLGERDPMFHLLYILNFKI